jgi:hypothetical protein
VVDAPETLPKLLAKRLTTDFITMLGSWQ